MVAVLKWMISQVKSKEYINKLNVILAGIDGKSHTEEMCEPRYQSIILFGYNIFPFSKSEYKSMVELLQKEA